MEDASGVIGHVEVDGLPVLYRYVDEAPSDEKRPELPWLTVISWTHDRDRFSERLNAVLHGQPRYPVDITFYHEPEWQEFAITRPPFQNALSRELQITLS